MGGCTIGVMENGELRDLYKDWSRINIVGIRWAFYLTSGHPSVGIGEWGEISCMLILGSGHHSAHRRLGGVMMTRCFQSSRLPKMGWGRQRTRPSHPWMGQTTLARPKTGWMAVDGRRLQTCKIGR